jgi:thymidine phosphorylase
VGKQLGLYLEVIITDGRQPVGRGIGPVFEARDVMQVLQGEPGAPADLRQKALRLAGRVIEFDLDVRGGDGFAIARDILDSGRALAKMNAIIDAQGRQKKHYSPGRLSFEMSAPASGYVISIDNRQVARIARFAGAPLVNSAGVDLHRKIGDKVKRGEPLYRVHAEVAADFQFARSLAARSSGYAIGRADQVPETVVEP